MNSLLALLPVTVAPSEILVLPLLVGWLWAIIDCITTKKLQRSDKVVWFIVLILLSLIAAIAYWTVRVVTNRKLAAQSST